MLQEEKETKVEALNSFKTKKILRSMEETTTARTSYLNSIESECLLYRYTLHMHCPAMRPHKFPH